MRGVIGRKEEVSCMGVMGNGDLGDRWGLMRLRMGGRWRIEGG